MSETVQPHPAPPALYRSRAGMRLIALLTLYNRGDFRALRQYFRQNSAASAAAPAAERLAELRLTRQRHGRLRFARLIGISELQAIVALTTEWGGEHLLARCAVEEDYPHLLARWQLSELDSETTDHE